MPVEPKAIDHTLLKPEATAEQIDRVVAEAAKHGFASVCVNPVWVPRVAAGLRGSGVDTCTVVGFPLGATTSATKAFEAREAVAAGAREVDMVIDIGALKGGDLAAVEADIAAVRAAAEGAVLKVIIEIVLLTDEEIVAACQAAERAGADFVKTSTGFAGGGATVAAVRLMRANVSKHIQVKASGGVRTREEAEAMIAAGASRIGTSNGVALVGG